MIYFLDQRVIRKKEVGKEICSTGKFTALKLVDSKSLNLTIVTNDTTQKRTPGRSLFLFNPLSHTEDFSQSKKTWYTRGRTKLFSSTLTK